MPSAGGLEEGRLPMAGKGGRASAGSDRRPSMTTRPSARAQPRLLRPPKTGQGAGRPGHEDERGARAPQPNTSRVTAGVPAEHGSRPQTRRTAGWAPNQAWVADTTYLATEKRGLSRAAILDSGSRRIVGGRCPSASMPSSCYGTALGILATSAASGLDGA